MLVTFPVTLVALVTAAVTARSPVPMVIDVALTAVTWPPIISCIAAPLGSDPSPPPCGANCVPPDGVVPAPPAFGVALAAGVPAASRIAKSATPNASAAATTAITAKSQPCLVWCLPGGGGNPGGGNPAGG